MSVESLLSEIRAQKAARNIVYTYTEAEWNSWNPDENVRHDVYMDLFGNTEAALENILAQFLAYSGLQHISEWRLYPGFYNPPNPWPLSGFDLTDGFLDPMRVRLHPWGFDQLDGAHYYNSRSGKWLYPLKKTPSDYITSEILRVPGHENESVFYLDFDAQGLPVYQFTMAAHDSADWAGLLQIVSIVIAPFLPGLGQMIGGAIVGPTVAAAYPAMTAAIGQTVISTVMSGGDLEGAVKGVALGYVGGQAGGFVGGQVTGVLDGYQYAAKIGEIASTLTSTAIKGGNIASGLVNLAIKNGASAGDVAHVSGADPMDDYIPFDFQTDGYEDWGDGYYWDPGDPSIPNSDILYNSNDGTTSTWDDNGVETIHYPDYDLIDNGDGTMTEYWKDGSISTVDMAGNVLAEMDTNGNVVGVNTGEVRPTPGRTIPVGTPGTQQASNGVNWPTIAATAVAALTAWTRAGQQNPMIGAPQQVGTSTVTPNKNGTITTRYANGQVVVSKMPVGTPYVFPDGITVVNNGDGTISTINPTTGQTTKTAIANVPTTTGTIGGGLFGSMSTQTMMIIGVGAVGLLLLTGKKGKK